MRNKLLTMILLSALIMNIILFPAKATSFTVNLGNVTLSGGYMANHFPEIWDLTRGDITINFTADLTGLNDSAGCHAWSELGIRQVGAGDFNPGTWQVGGKGVWLSTDYDWTPGTFAPDPLGAPTLDLDDKLLLQRGGGLGEGSYDLPTVPTSPGDNYGFWYDRDAVDQYQAQSWGAINGGTYNTNGLYHIVITLHAINADSGTAWMTVNGIQQGFYVGGFKNAPPEIYPAGLSFTGNMSQMQVFYGIYGYGAIPPHTVVFKDILVTGFRAGPSPADAYVDDDYNSSTPGWGYDHFAKVQDGIDGVAASGTVHVYDGTYNEALYINKSVTVRAESAPIIKGSQLFAMDYGNREAVIFVKNAANVILEGLDIEGEGLGPGKNYGVLYQNSSGTIEGCTISPNTISDLSSTGISAISKSNLRVQNCLVENFGRIGAYATNAKVEICNNRIIGQPYTASSDVNYGIEIEDYDGASDAAIIGNEIYNCGDSNPSPLWSSAAIIVDVWRYYGYAFAPSTVSMEYNNIHNNFEAIEIVSNSLSHANHNNIANNLYGVWTDPDENNNNATFDARFNWWGDASGPMQATTNPSGLGNDAGDYVDYSPWLEFVVNTSPMTFHVNPTGTIQEAVEEAHSGDTIRVHEGTYNEQVTVNKNNLHILTASSPIVDGTGLSTSGFLIMADYTEVGGFTIQNFTSTTSGVAGIELRGANHCWIHDNEIRTNNHGILFGDSSMTTYPSNNYNNIEHNTIHDNNNPSAEWYYTGIGINYWYGDSSHNTLYLNNIFNHNRNGILIGQHERYNPDSVGYGGHTDWTVLKNTVANSGWYGIEITNGLNSIIQQNTVTSAGSIGVMIQAWDYHAHDTKVDSNEIYNSGTGIYLVTQNTTLYTALSNINVTNNNIYSCTGYGINTWSTTATQITNILIGGNTVHDTNSIAMYLINLQDSTIENNHVYKAGHNGISIPSSSTVKVRFNEVNNCTYNGIVVYADNSRVEHNNIYYNGYSGIYINNGSPNAIVRYNNIHDNNLAMAATTAGIKIISNNAVIEYNTIENNKLDGIYVTSNNTIIQHNKITGNSGPYSGIHLTSASSGSEIYYNCIVGNTGTNTFGVYKEGGSTVNATYNWWGDSTGPYHPTKNPAGLGNNVSDYVLFEPWLKAYFEYYRKNPVVDETVAFDASLSIQCVKTITSYIWNFDDGTITTTTNPIITHSFSVPRTYNVTLTLTYDDATTATEWALVYVAKVSVFKVEPATIDVGLLNKTFQVNVTLNDLDINQRAVAVQFRLPYNATLIQFVDITEGAFMKQAGDTFFTYYVESSATYGPNVITGILVFPEPNGTWLSFPQGSGVLATITFRATYQERGLQKPPLSCSLTLNETLIIDDELQEVPHNTQNGVYRMHPTNIGDLNYDGKVDTRDVALVSKAFGTSPGNPRWNPICDIDSDGDIDIKDVAIVARNFGWISVYDP